MKDTIEPYNLFLDDERMPDDVQWEVLPLVEWTIVRNYKEFTDIIKKQGLPENIAFDHDLSDHHYKDYISVLKNKKDLTNPLRLNYAKYKEKTGLDCCKWLVEYCIKHNLKFPAYKVHSMNHYGKQNIISYIESYKKTHE